MNDKTGGPAFPVRAGSEDDFLAMGMTLRDYFAGQAMADSCGELDVLNDSQLEAYIKGRAKRLYAMADAMIAERNK